MLKSFGPIYVMGFEYPENSPKFPISEYAWTQETEEPFRFGRGVVFRLPKTRKAYGLGMYLGKKTEEEAMGAPFNRTVDIDEIRDALFDDILEP